MTTDYRFACKLP